MNDLAVHRAPTQVVSQHERFVDLDLRAHYRDMATVQLQSLESPPDPRGRLSLLHRAHQAVLQ
jgi:hypothetical protein